MNEVYLVKDGTGVRHFLSEADMRAAGFNKADKTVSAEEFNSNGCYARILDGEIVVGRTAEELAAEEKQERVTELKTELSRIDKDAGAGRAFRKSAIDMGVMLNALKKVAVEFGNLVKELRDANPELLNGFDPEANSEFKRIMELDFSNHYDIRKITEYENNAEDVRTRLKSIS